MQEREFWWIASEQDEPWAGLRIAVFTKTTDGADEVFVILGEFDQNRIGIRVWSDVSEREGWKKVEPIKVPDGYTI